LNLVGDGSGEVFDQAIVVFEQAKPQLAAPLQFVDGKRHQV
jgi:hypothetical protein